LERKPLGRHDKAYRNGWKDLQANARGPFATLSARRGNPPNPLMPMEFLLMKHIQFKPRHHSAVLHPDFRGLRRPVLTRRNRGKLKT
jgi:hypothetical protein